MTRDECLEAFVDFLLSKADELDEREFQQAMSRASA